MVKGKKVNKNIFENIIIAVAILLYYIIINFSYYRLEESIILLGLKIASIITLLISIIIFEVAYRKDSGKFAIYGIEILVVALHTLSITHIVEMKNLEFTTYIVISSFAFVIYYVLKALIMYTREKKNYLKSLSDIKDIVSNEPIKKKATKRK